MTNETKILLEKLAYEPLFEPMEGRSRMYFSGGTALSHYLDHRISYNIDFICTGKLPAHAIISFAISKGWSKVPHPNEAAFRIQSGEPMDDYVLTFSTQENVKVEFFFAQSPMQQGILSASLPKPYAHEGKLHILDLDAIAKLKVFALLNRQKSRDMFDATVMLEKGLIIVGDIEQIAQYHPSINISARKHLSAYTLEEDESLDFKKDHQYYKVFVKLKKQQQRAKLAKDMVMVFFERAVLTDLEDTKRMSMKLKRKK